MSRAAFADPKAFSVADVVARNSGIFVRQYGPGGMSTLSARGSSSSQSLVLVDGLPLSNSQLGQIDLAVLNPGLFQSADVVSGAASAQYGSAAVGSVINLRTRTQPGSHASVEFQSGSFAERGIAAMASHSAGKLQGSFALSMLSSDGDFRFRNEAAFPVRWDRRENADIDQKALLASITRSGGSSVSSVSVLTTDADRGLPGLSTVQNNGERQSDLLRRFSAQHHVTVGRSTATVRGFIDRASLRYVNPLLGLDETGVSRTAMVEGEYQHRDHTIQSSTGFSVAYQLADHPSIQANRVASSAAAFNSFRIVAGRVLFYPAIRLDVHRSSDRKTFIVPSPRIGLNAKLRRDASLRLKASAGRSFRVPTFNDLYWKGPGALGNRDLRPEDGWSGDIGLHFSRTGSSSDPAGNTGEAQSAFEVQFSVFGSVVRDQIVWTSGIDGIWKPENVGEVRARGIEVDAGIDGISSAGITVSTGLTYSYTDAREFGMDDEVRGVRYVPKHRFRASGILEYHGFTFDAVLISASKRLVTIDGRQSVPAYRSIDLTAGRTVAIGRYQIGGHASVLNLFNESYAVVKGYPMPPRSFRITLRFQR
jgi:iron complex outermembrane receptor protein